MTTSARVVAPIANTLRSRVETERNVRSARAHGVPEILRDGTAVHGTAMVLRALPGGGLRSDSAVVASRKIGNAVTRNRAKRRLREALRAAGSAQELDVVVIARVAALSAPMETLIREVRELTARAASKLSEGEPA